MLAATLALSLLGQPADARPIALFNGESLAGWTMDVPALDDNHEAAKPFLVRDGLLVTLGQPMGHLITDREFDNYRLEVEYRFAGRGNSGVLVHVSTPRFVSFLPKSLEIQMQTGNAGDFIALGETIERRVPEGIEAPPASGRRSPRFVATAEHPPGEWNTLQIECRADTVRVWLNDVLVNEGHSGSATRGRIALQSEGTEVAWRRVVLTPLE